MCILVARTIFVVSLYLLTASPVLADDEDGAKDEQIDDVVVIGQKQRRQIRMELRNVERQMYATFNELNADDDYDIVCRRYVPIGSQIPRTKCKARLYWQALSELGEDEAEGYTIRPVTNHAQHEKLLRMKMLQFAISNEKFRGILQERKRLRDQLAK